ncbi:MAG: dihydrolipoamide succinyltransferase [Ferrovum sp. 37-45-19]|jgi:2-oxoglutarate dehydrogenase E2 component (dihydrolipoamide succinyltransferase)|uniref:2-oxoglutarate dehydrogenase complex dihydrolipoyllysine-residue succinyltransferase n=1 Tax=Ferrovum sp. JA12 TaxID=1356299 RepID=UPI000703BA16|nr:2-oxoglutarate dehydrogenase complex dihydrolipoyllysine-residue succinyltransferase [Ferrovum sp. JA12]OYV80287.1 MAG: dihydrolipoamide succinyltransferase [Ferrovum sp. 21-44-67]OYV95033.1 MAG: dihydrolipoamide succinyltransferase [Ferrovum sp. 37-45-19]HQT80911.1 2-oxoglutarate dehydrogenase complex dihydrolipoyllysine-residue succinyltransferase [Ferrovaceae bacterium]KRH78753.1 dihydrolipoyllysine-residue succinyltransferase component of 2-oxoglutarate dehydrogenase complex [Ferrovum sp
MIIEVKVPQLSESVAEATLLTWNKAVGEMVTRDENLIDVETDKVVLELPAPASGKLVSILKKQGDQVVSDEVIATIDTEAKTDQTEEPASNAAVIDTNVSDKKTIQEKPVKTSIAMPAAKKMLAENNLDVQQTEGTGRGGRVTKADVIRQLTQPKATSAVANNTINSVGDRVEQRVPMSRLRARIAERLVESQSTAAILTTFNEVNMQPVMDLRNKYKDKFEKEHGVKLGFMSFFVKAVVSALKKYPIVNASIDGNDIIYHGFYDIGIAVGSARGLVVPILRNADQMSIAEIEKQIADFGNRAKDGKITLEELTGGTFSISNGGVFGSMLSTPIINPPQSAILGVHATKERPVVENGQIVIRPMNYFAMSYDHRIIDGREAVLTLVAIKEALEDPARLLLDI